MVPGHRCRRCRAIKPEKRFRFPNTDISPPSGTCIFKPLVVHCAHGSELDMVVLVLRVQNQTARDRKYYNPRSWRCGIQQGHSEDALERTNPSRPWPSSSFVPFSIHRSGRLPGGLGVVTAPRWWSPFGISVKVPSSGRNLQVMAADGELHDKYPAAQERHHRRPVLEPGENLFPSRQRRRARAAAPRSRQPSAARRARYAAL